MLELSNVSCGYAEFDVCKNIDIKMQKGQFTSIIGPNGAGKTTLLKAISGIIRYKGNITLNDKDLKYFTRKERGQKIGLLSQSIDSYFNYSIYDTVLLGRYSYLKGVFGSPGKEDHKVVKKSLQLVGLLDMKDTNINQLSGGQLQRVFLARTIAQQPDVILLDEPTNHLDFKHQVEILDFVREWSITENKIVIAVLHDLNIVQKYSDYILLLHNGKTFSKGTTKRVLTNENLLNVYDIDVKEWMQHILSLWE